MLEKRAVARSLTDQRVPITPLAAAQRVRGGSAKVVLEVGGGQRKCYCIVLSPINWYQFQK
jgi:hypothetical protein